MKSMFTQITMFVSVWYITLSPSLACTDFKIMANDGTILITRSMEFAQNLSSNLITALRGNVIHTIAPSGNPGMSWKAKYGYVFLDALDTGKVVDGMNDQGLSIEALYLPGETQYQTVPKGQDNHALPYLDLGAWVLGNFKNVDEVKQSLSTIYVFESKLPILKDFIFPLHYAIYDNTGKSIVVEFTEGNMRIYDNALGVLTNSPTYPWHITNLRNYLNLSPNTPQPIVDAGITFTATGQGAGMVGLPGDISPPSRFTKIAIMLKTILKPSLANDAINMAQHIINNVDIPLGWVREVKKIDTATNELTQWVVFKDLTHYVFYYRTYGDLSLHAINLTKIDLSEHGRVLKMPIASSQYIIDMTQTFLNS